MNSFIYKRNKTIVLTMAVTACLGGTLAAHDTESPATDSCCGEAVETPHVYRPDDHAPAGVMADHTHAKGDWMVGYYFMNMSQSGLREGSGSTTEAALAGIGFEMAPVEMTMQMHMFDLMYAPCDRFTLMVMPQYTTMDMKMRVIASNDDEDDSAMPMHKASLVPMHGEGDDHSMGMVGDMHSHSVSGWGDTTVAGLVKIFQSKTQTVHATIGISLPTGSVSVKRADGVTFTHYGMQLGSGTWDFKPGITYRGKADAYSWGAQVNGVYRMEDENESGFRFGNRFEATAWTAWKVASFASLSTRINYQHEGHLTGHYNGAHEHTSPPDLQANYGYDVVEAGVGINLFIPNGPLAGHRAGVEVLWPLHEDYYGIQLGRDYTLTASWSWAF